LPAQRDHQPFERNRTRERPSLERRIGFEAPGQTCDEFERVPMFRCFDHPFHRKGWHLEGLGHPTGR
jgi:hypothetical protein